MTDSTAPTARARALRQDLFANDLTATEVAHILDLDESTVRRRLADGTLPGYRLGREWRVTETALRAYVAQLKHRPGAVVSYDGANGGVRVPGVTHPITTSMSYITSGAATEHDEP